MADQPTFEDHESAPLHRPGMANVANRGTAASTSTASAASDARDTNGSRVGDRPAVRPGKMDPFGAQASSSDPAPTAPIKSAPKTAATDTAPGYAGQGGLKREAVTMDAVDRAVTGQP